MRASKDARETQRRIENIREIPSALVSFQARDPEGKLQDFLARLSLDTRKDDGEDADEAKDEVSLMTLHGAKGLEFDVVFLLGMEEGLLPHGRTLAEGSSDDICEERRLAYVGITRARKVLTLSGARIRLKYGKVERRKVSRFVYEIPDGPARRRPRRRRAGERRRDGRGETHPRDERLRRPEQAARLVGR